MQYQFSTAIASFCSKTGLEKAMIQVKAAGYDCLDFPFSIYSVGYRPPLLQEDWKGWLRSVMELSCRLQLPITQGHAAWLQDIPSDFHYTPPSELCHRTIEAAAILGCKHLVFHPVRLRERIDSSSLGDKIHDWNVRWFHDLVRTAEKHDVYINIENTFDSHFQQKPEDPAYPFTTAEHMLHLLHDIGSDRIRLCLDTGHANNSKQDIPAMIRAFRNHLATVHLNDNYGTTDGVFSDLHLFPGKGRISWDPVIQALKDIRFKGNMNIEPIDSLPTVDDQARIRLLYDGREELRRLISSHNR